jgi:hypothetical protein
LQAANYAVADFPSWTVFPLAISVNIRNLGLRPSLSLSCQAMLGPYPTPASQVADIVV